MSAAAAEQQASGWSWTWRLTGSDPLRTAPPAYRSGPVSVWFAGELFDPDGLANELATGPKADAALVGQAYAHWGVSVFHRLRGAFAVAIADDLRRRILVARDHVGLHPLFYAAHADAISFASMPRALLALSGVSRAWNAPALADALCHRYPDSGETFFRAIRRLPPGHSAVLEHGRLELKRYWDPMPTEGRRERAVGDEHEEFASLQARAVARCQTPGRTGIFLSGGLDSVSLAHAATEEADRQGAPRPLALSLALPDPECDERPLQVAVARELGLRQHLMELDAAVGRTNLASQCLSLNQRLSSPLFNVWTPPYLALARAGRDLGASTILTGNGGDEFLSASIYVITDRMRRGDVLGASRFAREWRRSEEGSWLLWRNGVRPLASQTFARAAGASWAERRARRILGGDPAWVAPTLGLREERLVRVQQSLAAHDADPESAASDVERSLSHVIAQQEREQSFDLGRAAGIRFRHPYYDPDLVAFLNRAPIGVLNTGGWLKGLVRRQLGLRFPALGFDRQRKVLATGLVRSTLVNALSHIELRTATFPALSALGIVDGVAARETLLAAWPNGLAVSRMWDLLNLETWMLEQGTM